MTRLDEVGEFGLIDLIVRHPSLNDGRVIKGIGDDCAVIDTGGAEATLATVDTMVEGIHFDLSGCSPEGLGAKLLAVNLSDIAAMGGIAHTALLTISAAPDSDATIIERLVGGLKASGARHNVQLAGGDTTSTRGPLVLSLTLLGSCPENQVVYRSGARVGDFVYVTGTPGDSAAGLQIQSDAGYVSGEDREYLLRRHHRPEPRVQTGRRLAEDAVASAMIDVSDGLAADLRHICVASGVDMVIEPQALPASESLRAYCQKGGLDPVDAVLEGGEDYELAFTSRSEFASDWSQECRLSYIGRVVEGNGVVYVGDGDSIRPYEIKGFDHFTKGQ